MPSNKTVLTTGEVAKICSVAPRTVSKWFDSGQLRGYRIPGSKDRRIPLDDLIRFMRAHGIPLNGLDDGRLRVLVLDGDTRFSATMRRGLIETGAFEVCATDCAIEAGAVAQEVKPHVMIVDVTLTDVNPSQIVRWARTTPDLKDVRLIGIGQGLTSGSGEALRQDGFDGYLSKPFEMSTLINLIEETLPALAAMRQV